MASQLLSTAARGLPTIWTFAIRERHVAPVAQYPCDGLAEGWPVPRLSSDPCLEYNHDRRSRSIAGRDVDEMMVRPGSSWPISVLNANCMVAAPSGSVDRTAVLGLGGRRTLTGGPCLLRGAVQTGILATGGSGGMAKKRPYQPQFF